MIFLFLFLDYAHNQTSAVNIVQQKYMPIMLNQ